MRPEHVFLLDPPVVIDCLEFDAGLRRVDPFDEVAYLGLECDMAGDPTIGARLHARLVAAGLCAPPAALMRLYVASRALLRARLSVAHLFDEHPRDAARWRPLAALYLQRAERQLGAAPARPPVASTT
jgi:aminoglycoside phosphotransferase family enzyme